MALGPAQGRACDKLKVFLQGPSSTEIDFLLKNGVLDHFWTFLAIFGPSRPQKWIRLEISIILVVSGGLYDENKSISQKIYGSEGGWVPWRLVD